MKCIHCLQNCIIVRKWNQLSETRSLNDSSNNAKHGKTLKEIHDIAANILYGQIV